MANSDVEQHIFYSPVQPSKRHRGESYQSSGNFHLSTLEDVVYEECEIQLSIHIGKCREEDDVEKHSDEDTETDSNNEETEDSNTPHNNIARIHHSWQLRSFEILETLGSGSYGEVFQARDTHTGENLAVKKLKVIEGVTEEVVLRECDILQSLNHKNIVVLKDICRLLDPPATLLVFELCFCDLWTMLTSDKVHLTLSNIKSISKQTLEGLHYIHSKGILHRDLKLSNILVMTDGIVKIADFGMARFQSSTQCYSPDVATLHYRSPELLLGATKYGPAVDIWSFGCITVELFVRAKFITGTTEQAQLLCIIGMLGTIDRDTMPADLDLPYLDNMALPTNPHPNIKHILKKYVKNQDAIHMLLCLLQLNPDHRLDCATALSHSFFTASPKPENVKLDTVNNQPVTVTDIHKCFGHLGPLQVAGYNIIPPGVNIIPASHFIHQACVQGLLPPTHLKALFPQAQLHAMFPQTQLQTLLPQFLNPH